MLVRALIVLLAILNLGAAAWWIGHDVPPPPAAPALPPGVTRLQLISESGFQAPPPPRAAETPAVAPATTAAAAPELAGLTTPPGQKCFSFGPFASATAAEDAAAKLRPRVQKLSTHDAGAAGSTRSWRVFLPARANAQEAQDAAERIAAAGFSDYFIVREGDEANSIALGRYRNEDGARSRMQALVAAGFDVRMEPMGQESTATWLDVIADEAFDPRRAQAAIAAAQHRKADCAALR